MKIAVILGRYPPVFGGATPTLITLFSELVKRGHEVHFITPRYSSAHKKHESLNNIKIVRLRPGLHNSFSEIFFLLNSITYIRKENIQPDLIFDTMPYGISMPILFYYANQAGIPVIARLSQVGANEPLAASRGRLGSLKRLCMHKYDYTICLSTALEKTCEMAGIEKGKYGKIFNCVDETRFRPLTSEQEVIGKRRMLLPNKSDPIVIVPGSVSPRKRSHLALYAWKIIKQVYHLEGTLLFVGPLSSSGQQFDNSYISKIMSYVEENGLQKSVVFAGQKEMIEDYYKISDILLFVSNREGLPNVLLEGMSCGLPIVATKIKYISEDIFQDKVEGLYTTDDPADIANKLSTLMLNGSERIRMAKRCIDKSRIFKAGEIADQVEEVFRQVVIQH